MIYLRHLELHVALDHVGYSWARVLPGLDAPQNAVWKLCTPVRDEEVVLAKSRFFKSLKDECNDKGKKTSLSFMVRALRHAVLFNDYQASIKDSGIVDVKEAFGFTHRGKNHKVWELKYQKKDRLYFCTLQGVGGNERILIPLLFHHKKDDNTPAAISSYCETAMKPMFEPSVEIKII